MQQEVLRQLLQTTNQCFLSKKERYSGTRINADDADFISAGNCDNPRSSFIIGFMVADALAKEAGTAFKDGRYGFTTTLSIKGRQLILLKPSTFMNLSGNAVRYWMQKENIPLENVLIVVDDLALPFGTLRLKGKGSDAGHNGLKHIAATLGTQNYARLRFGIGNDFPRGGQVDFVLGHFTDEDWKTMDERLKMAGEIIKSFCLAGIDITMNQFNKK